MKQNKKQFNINKINNSIKRIEKDFNKIDEWFIPRDRSSFYLTHDFHPYFAAFPPELVKRLLKKYSKNGDVFLDPFMGGGSSIVEGFKLGRKVIGVDISPFSKFISETKAKPIIIYKEKIYNLLLRMKKDAYEHRLSSYKNFSYKIPDVINIDKWFIERSKFDLAIMLYHIKKIQNKKLKDFLLLAFSSIIRKSSNAKNAQQHLCIKREKKIPEPLFIFANKLNIMIPQMEQYVNETIGGSDKFFEPKLYAHDVRKLNKILKEKSVDIVITSPPYGTGSRYTDINRLSFEWLEFKKPSRKETLETTKEFSSELKKSLQEIFRVLKKNKYCFFVYGDPSTENSITRKAIYNAQESGFKYVGLISCPIEKTMSNHHEKYRRFIPKDFILIFKK